MPLSDQSASPRTNKREFVRPVVQLSFVLASIIIGLRFHYFVASIADSPTQSVAYRPPAVEAYLPISSLMSLVYLIKSGIATSVHPAGLVIFTLVLTLTLALRRGFCSWVCPIGTAAEYLHRLGKQVIGRNLLMPIWLDIPLRGIKYLLLGFFLYVILGMSVVVLKEFIDSPYNKIADVKMYLFFAQISPTAIRTIAILAVLSFVFKNFWCRYLCPYGALLCISSLVSPTHVTRNVEVCTDCGACTRACPNRIPVHKKTRVHAGECTACFSCVDACPTSRALTMKTIFNRAVPKLVYAAIVVILLYFTGEVASAFGYWHSATTPSEYRSLYKIISQLSHSGGM